MTPHILAIGNPVYSRIETPELTCGPRTLSGCTPNASLGIARLGGRATLIGAVGDDVAEDLHRTLAQEGVGLIRYPSRETGGFHICYDSTGARTLRPLALADPIPASVPIPDSVDGVILGPIFNEVSVDLARAVRQATQAPILLDPQGLLRIIEAGQVVLARTAVFDALAPLVDIIKANEDEALVITGIDPRIDPVGAARALHALGGAVAIVTLAERGSVIVAGHAVYQIPAVLTHAVDPTGAGDLYAAGWFLHTIAAPNDLAGAGRFATAVASLMVEHRGSGFRMSRAEAEQRAATLLDKVLHEEDRGSESE